MDSQEKIYQLALSLSDNVGPITARKLISHFGSATAVYQHSPRQLRQIFNIGEARAKSIVTGEAVKVAESEIAYAAKNDIRVISLPDADYPRRLKHCEDAPLVLFVKGKIDLNQVKVVSIVGTRKATEYGKERVKELINQLQPHQPLIISGLAYGIDIAAHRAALKNNLHTAAVLAHGLDRLYPFSHHAEAGEIAETGALITEFPSGTNPDRENFPKRNRIVAGMSDVTIVVESGISGGSMITADLAHSYNREVMAVPGRIGDPQSRGCLQLIKSNKAALLESTKDLEDLMGWTMKPPANPIQQSFFIDLPDDEQQVFDLLESEEKPIDEICAFSGQPMSKISSLLLTLELKGLVKALPGKLYKRL